ILELKQGKDAIFYGNLTIGTGIASVTLSIDAGSGNYGALKFDAGGSSNFCIGHRNTTNLLLSLVYGTGTGNSNGIIINSTGDVSIGKVPVTGLKLDVEGDINLGNVATAVAGELNRGYYVYKSGAISYGMKLQYAMSGYGTMIFSANQANRFVAFGKCGSVMEDDDMHISAYFDLDDDSLVFSNGAKITPI
ncbi:unnamed protein product, partial [marine sediment metagenome]